MSEPHVNPAARQFRDMVVAKESAFHPLRTFRCELIQVRRGYAAVRNLMLSVGLND